MNAVRIRQVAVVVASLDQGVARRLLSELPKHEAAAVRAEIERLDDVDPEEQEAALAAFRRSRQQRVEPEFQAGQRTSSSQRDMHAMHEGAFGVEAVFSQASEAEDAAASRESGSPRDAALSRALAGIEPPEVAGLLLGEHPQVIAAALSKMDYDHAAAVFAALPDALQQDVLPRISNLQIIDDEAMATLESQLVQWTAQQLQIRRQRAASKTLANKILSKTSPRQRAALTGQPSEEVSAVPEKPLTTVDAPGGTTASRTSVGSAAWRRPPLLKMRRWGAISAWGGDCAADAVVPSVASPGPALVADAPSPSDSQPTHASPPQDWEDRSLELEQLDDARLLYVLQHAEEETLRRALAASGDGLWHRIAQRFSRRRTARLRREVFAMGPTKVRDLRRAQHELLELAARRAA